MELTRHGQRPQEAQQAREGRNTILKDEQQHLGAPRDVDGEGENSQTREHDPYRSAGDDHDGEAQGRNDEGNNPIPRQPERRAQSWEQRFRGIQQELGHIKEVVKGRTPISMEALVQWTKSPFTVGVLHFPLPTKFIMPQIKAFDGTKDLVDHLNTYKNQMKLHGYQDPVRCRAFAITLKGSALAWFNRLLPASISSFKELSIAFMSHELLTVKQGPQENRRSYVQRFN